jgi:gamma-glutamylcyclotransferase (GGCT)/AIG2-like uncharacterized protein YtfP
VSLRLVVHEAAEEADSQEARPAPDIMNPNLFVYGTLISAARHPMGERMRRESRLLGAASIEGKLFSLGKYPGLVEAPGEGMRVHGEVYALNAPAASLEWLDAYEGIEPGDHANNAYKRVECIARLASGEDVAAWVYVYLRPVVASSLVPDGRWQQPRAP